MPSWNHVLPCPPQHGYHTRPPVTVLMRCAERYDLDRYTSK